MKKFIVLPLSVILCCSMISCAWNTNASGGDTEPLAIVKTENKNNKIEVYETEQTSEENGLKFEHVENVDNQYYFYYFYLGTIKQVPSYSSAAMQYAYDTEVTLSFTSLTEEILSNTVSKAEVTIDTHSYTGGFALDFEQELSAEVGPAFAKVKNRFKSSQSTDHHWTNNWGSTVSDSNSTTSSYLNSYNKGYEEKITFSKEAGFTKGNYYRMSFYETVKAYGVLIYDAEKDKYYSAAESFLKSNSTIRVWEESKDGSFDYEQAGNLAFDIEAAISYAKANPPTQNETDDESENVEVPEAKTISVIMNRYNCNDGNGYNKDEQEESADWRSRHNGYEIGTLNLYGCAQVGEYYQVVDKDKFAIRYKVLENTDDLPRVDTQLTHIEDDDATRVKGTNIESRVGCGAYWIRVTYADDSQTQYNKTNILKNATSGTIVDILTLDDIDTVKEIQKVEVVVVYEIYAGAPGVFGIWWHEYSNWRCEWTYNFNI